jgi:gamma-glutamylcyclotransferase (GGCT)/AIG2-like uncharacterized protein YtfP
MLPAVHWLFVYGTLMPGRLRWPHVADLVAETRPATVPGTLYDTGRGYPALLLSEAPEAPGSPAVEGVLLGVRDEDAVAVLALLDEVEGPEYRRVGVTTADGTHASTYEWVGPRNGFRALAGRWDRSDER